MNARSHLGIPANPWGKLGSGEEVVVARGGVVLPDDGSGIEHEDAQVVDATADALAAAGLPLAALRLVVGNRAGADGQRRAGVVEHPAAEPVAAAAAPAALGQVVIRGGVADRDRRDRPEQRRKDVAQVAGAEAATQRVAAAAAGAARPADRVVVRDRAAA